MMSPMYDQACHHLENSMSSNACYMYAAAGFVQCDCVGTHDDKVSRDLCRRDLEEAEEALQAQHGEYKNELDQLESELADEKKRHSR